MTPLERAKKVFEKAWSSHAGCDDEFAELIIGWMEKEFEKLEEMNYFEFLKKSQ